MYYTCQYSVLMYKEKTCIDKCIDIREVGCILIKKMVSFRIDTKLLDKLNRLKESKTDVIHKALEMYLQSQENVNTVDKESVNTKRNTTVNTVNQKITPHVKVVENYEFMEYLKRDNEWLKGLVEHFEHTQDGILAKIDTKPMKEKPSVSWFRM